MAVRVHANCAMSLDGCLGLPGPRPLKLSGPEDMRRVHELRAANDAILVGVGTVLADDPKLTVKWELLGRPAGRNPARIVLDGRLRTPPSSELSRHDALTILFHAKGASGGPSNAQRIVVSQNPDGSLALEEVLRELDERGFRRLLVEGGSKVLSALLRADLVDELTVFVAPIFVGHVDAPRIFAGDGPFKMALGLVESTRLDTGILLRFRR